MQAEISSTAIGPLAGRYLHSWPEHVLAATLTIDSDICLWDRRGPELHFA